MKITANILLFIILAVFLSKNVNSSENMRDEKKTKTEISRNHTDKSTEVIVENDVNYFSSIINEKQYNGFKAYWQIGDESICAICATLTFTSILGNTFNKNTVVQTFLGIGGEPDLEGYSELDIVQVFDKLKVQVPVNPKTGKSSWKKGNIEKLTKIVAEYGPVIVRLEDVIYSHFVVVIKIDSESIYYFDSTEIGLKEISFDRFQAYWDNTYLQSRHKTSREMNFQEVLLAEKVGSINPVYRSTYGYHYFLNPTDDYIDASLTVYSDFIGFDSELFFAYGFGGFSEDSYSEIYFGTSFVIPEFSGNNIREFGFRTGFATEFVLNSNSTYTDTKHLGMFNVELPNLFISNNLTELTDLFINIGYSVVLRPSMENIEWSIIGGIGYKSSIGNSYTGVPYIEISLVYNKFLAVGKYNKKYFEISYRFEPVIIEENIIESMFQVLSLQYSGGNEIYYRIALEFSIGNDLDFTIATIFSLGLFS